MDDKLQRLSEQLRPIAAPRAARPPASREEAGSLGELGLREYWKVIHARRSLVLGCTLLALAAAAVYNTVAPPTYRASATLQIDREQANLAQISEQQGPLFPEQPDYIETQYKILRSRSLARTVIEQLEIGRRRELTYKIPSEELKTQELHPRVLDAFLERLAVRPSKGTRLVDVSYESVDGELAASVVNTLTEAFIERNLESRWNATQKASRWLEQQLDSLEAKLQASESTLQGYAAAHSILFVEERKDITTEKLAQFEQELTRVEAERIEAESSAVLGRAAAQRGAPPPAALTSEVYAELAEQLEALRREQARQLVTFAPEYPSVERLRREMDEVERALGEERTRIFDGVQERYQLALKREELLSNVVASQRGKVNQLGNDFIAYTILKRDAETNRQLYDGLLQRLKEAGVSAGLRASNIAVLDPAEVPETTYRPMTMLNYAVGLGAGLLLGVALAFAGDHLQTRIRTPEEVERLTALGLLAVIPRSRGKHERKAPRRLIEGGGAMESWQPEQDLAEAYRTLRSSVLLGADESMRRILVTSAQPQEGKTTLSLNLACSLAQLGRRVLLIDADMRRPDCAYQLDVRGEGGLSEYLRGEIELEQALQATSIAGLSLISAGRSTATASDLLHSPRLAELLAAVGAQFEHVVLDSPPSLVLSDARTISRLVEGVVLVVSDQTERGSLLRTKRIFDDAGVSFLGFVMNRVNLNQLDYGYYRDYGYHYDYSAANRKKGRRGHGRAA